MERRQRENFVEFVGRGVGAEPSRTESWAGPGIRGVRAEGAEGPRSPRCGGY